MVILDNDLWAVERCPEVSDRPGIRGLSPFEPIFFVGVVAGRLFVGFIAPAESIIIAGTELLSSDPAQRLAELGHLL